MRKCPGVVVCTPATLWWFRSGSRPSRDVTPRRPSENRLDGLRRGAGAKEQGRGGEKGRGSSERRIHNYVND